MCNDTLFSSGRLFSEGGDFAPQELKLLQRRLTEEAKQIVVKEEAFYSDMEEFESSSLQQVKLLRPYVAADETLCKLSHLRCCSSSRCGRCPHVWRRTSAS